MIRILISMLALAAAQIQADEFADEFSADGLDQAFNLADDIPVVLTASRLRQPRAEVPASVTVIEAEQIQAWGVRSLPELLRFVPGMFVGHGDDQNNPSVVYHASSSSLMRRIQVLVDGRSVFRAGIAAVVWDDIPVAMEDILRVEVTRGPNAAAYGANSFLAVINIMTKHPGDTLGTRIRYRNGSQGIDDAFASHAWNDGLSSYRLTLNIQADDGFDGMASAGKGDNFRDSKRHGFVSGYFSRQLQGNSQLNAQASLKKGHTDIRIADDYLTTPPDQDVLEADLMVRLQHDFSLSHQSHLQAYVSRNVRDQNARVCAPTLLFDPDLYTLYAQNPDAVGYLLAEDQAALIAALQTPEQAALVTDISSRYQTAVLGGPADNLNLCGSMNQDITEQRMDVEWQDTVQWNGALRTVSGVSVRRDQVTSEAYFGGTLVNDTLRLFTNAEWRAADFLLVNVGAMYEDENTNQSEVSPRVAFNWMLSPQQSIRMVYSEAVRSPDLLEQEPHYTLKVKNASDNYLGEDNLTFFMHQDINHRGLKPERIASSELGYYLKISEYRFEADLKVFQERLSNLISSPINLATSDVRDDGSMAINGAEMQLQWRPTARDMLWFVAAYVDADVTVGDVTGLDADEVSKQKAVETRLSAQNSMVVSWNHRGDQWSATGSHIWYDGYNDGRDIYRRIELNLRKEWRMSGTTPWIGGFWQHMVSDDNLIYKNQRYSERNIYYLQLGLDF